MFVAVSASEAGKKSKALLASENGVSPRPVRLLPTNARKSNQRKNVVEVSFKDQPSEFASPPRVSRRASPQIPSKFLLFLIY